MTDRSWTTLLVKLNPGVDVTLGLSQAIHDAGWARGEIVNAIGSLNAGVLDGEPGADAARLTVPGPGLEVASISGEVRAPAHAGSDDTSLRASVCDQHGAVFSGRLVTGENIVCITLEALVRRTDQSLTDERPS